LRHHSDLTLLTATTAIPAPVLSMLARRLDSILVAYNCIGKPHGGAAPHSWMD
jgi:hypothetical protein